MGMKRAEARVLACLLESACDMMDGVTCTTPRYSTGKDMNRGEFYVTVTDASGESHSYLVTVDGLEKPEE